jgi:hypothetical protein
MDIRDFGRPECGSHHRTLEVKTYFAYIKETQKHEQQKNKNLQRIEKIEQCKYKLESFKGESIRFFYQLRIEQKFKKVFENVKELQERMKKAVHDCAHEALGTVDVGKKLCKKVWWNEEIEKEVTEKKEANLRWLNTKSADDRQVHVNKRNNARISVMKEMAQEVSRSRKVYWR